MLLSASCPHMVILLQPVNHPLRLAAFMPLISVFSRPHFPGVVGTGMRAHSGLASLRLHGLGVP